MILKGESSYLRTTNPTVFPTQPVVIQSHRWVGTEIPRTSCKSALPTPTERRFCCTTTLAFLIKKSVYVEVEKLLDGNFGGEHTGPGLKNFSRLSPDQSLSRNIGIGAKTALKP